MGFAVICLFFLLLIPPTVQAASGGSIQALRFSQTHFYWGDTDVIVSMRAVRIINCGSMRFNLVARHPDWNVTVFRDDDKVMLKKEYQEFINEGLIASIMLKKKKERFTDRGLASRDFKFGPVKAKHVETADMTMDYLPLHGVAERPVEEILYSAFRVPTNGGIPIRYTKSQTGVDWLTGIDAAGSRKVYLGTKTIRAVTVPDSFFDPPTNYKTTRVMQQVLVSKTTRESSGDLDVLFDYQGTKAGSLRP